MKRHRVFIYLAFIVILLVPSFYIARSQDFYRAKGSDFFSLWLAPHLLLQGKDPYQEDIWVPAHGTYGADWISDPTYLYPLPLAVLMLPFGFFHLNIAAGIWVFFCLAALCVVSWRMMAAWGLPKILPYWLPALAGLLLFRPTFLTFLVGQMEILVMLCLAGTALLWERGEWFKGGVLASVVLMKPQVGLPLLGLLTLWLLVKRHWNALLGIGMAVIGSFVLGALFDINWVGRWLSIGHGKVSGVFGYSPTIWGLSSTLCSHQSTCTALLGGSFSIAVMAAVIWLILRRSHHRPWMVIGVVIPVALLVTPYLWAYTQVLLVLPILLVMENLYRRKLPYLLVALFPLGMAVLAFGLLFAAVDLGSDVWSVLVPLISLILLGLLPGN